MVFTVLQQLAQDSANYHCLVVISSFSGLCQLLIFLQSTHRFHFNAAKFINTFLFAESKAQILMAIQLI